MNRPVRRSQAIAPFGIGALIDFPGPVSLVHAGLDAWPFDPAKPEHREFKVEDEPRLARRLGVDFFVQPPDFRMPNGAGSTEAVNAGLKLPFLRFPLWHSCPRCGRMFETRYQDRSAPQCTGPVGSGGEKGKTHKARRTVQVRFVTVCRDGHMRDFPWIEWLGLEPEEWNRTRSDRWLRLLSTGSASIAGVIVVAERQQENVVVEVKRRSLTGAFGGDLGVKCDSQVPALGIGDGGDDPGEACPQKLQAVLRGASNLYFSDVRSSIYIPEVKDAAFPQDVLDILEDHEFKQELLNAAILSEDGTLSRKAVSVMLKRRRPESEVDPAILADAANKHVLHEALTQHRPTATLLAMRAKNNEGRLTATIVAEVISASLVSEWEIDPTLLVAPLNHWLEARLDDSPGDGQTAGAEVAEEAFRFEEYATFCRDGQEGMPKINLLVRSHSMDSYEPVVRDRFSRIALLDKLRETRAFVGYSRLFAASSQDSDKRWKLISRARKNWLPAVVVRGEGIFLVFDSAKLDRWQAVHGAFHRERLVQVNRNVHAQASRREIHASDVEPKFVLLHTFAHALINQLTFDCGYGSSSLRERIYFSDEHPRMSGVLIYTAAGDSEGTMGGLVRMGSPALLEPTIARAVDRARWCSSDPVCIESLGQGPDNCNLAACHSCALLPETSCEQQNRLLDRGVLVGTLDRPDTGFFSQGDWMCAITKDSPPARPGTGIVSQGSSMRAITKDNLPAFVYSSLRTAGLDPETLIALPLAILQSGAIELAAPVDEPVVCELVVVGREGGQGIRTSGNHVNVFALAGVLISAVSVEKTISSMAAVLVGLLGACTVSLSPEQAAFFLAAEALDKAGTIPTASALAAEMSNQLRHPHYAPAALLDVVDQLSQLGVKINLGTGTNPVIRHIEWRIAIPGF